MRYNLTGTIENIKALKIDDTLTKLGEAADAKATGDAINAVKDSQNKHESNKENPHGVTKSQIGLGDVDNTADADKPVSTAQATAIADAKKAGTDAQAALSNYVGKEEGKGLSTNDFTTAEKEKLAGIEAGANKYVLNNGAVTAAKLATDAKSKGVAIVLTAGGWANNTQNVSVEGVTSDNNVVVGPAPESRDAWNDAEIYCNAQGNGTLTFKCGSAPAENVTANVVILV